jgi:DNA topoisomerase I
MVLKKGRFGTFFACTGYPTARPPSRSAARRRSPMCRWTRSARNCGNNLVLKYGPLRRVHRLQQLSDLQVRQAEDHRREVPGMQRRRVVERRSKRGKTFYGCNRYPDCNFVAWGKPVPEKCPECGRPPWRECRPHQLLLRHGVFA